MLSPALPFAAQQPATPMQVVLLGTGFPRPSADRAGPADAIVAGKKTFIVDAGRGVVMRLAGANLPLDSIQCVFLTHLHSDHIDGLPDLYNTPWVLRTRQAFRTVWPCGHAGDGRWAPKVIAGKCTSAAVTEMLLEGAKINVHIVNEGVVYQDSDVKVTAFAVDHRPVVPAFGYRFESGEKVIVISGDTRPSDNLIRHARGADVLVHEAYLSEYFSKTDNPEVAARLRAYHTTAEQAGQVAAAAGVKMLVLTHLIPGDKDAEFKRRASESFKGKIVVGHDLARF